MKWILSIILTILNAGLWVSGYAQITFKETTNSYRYNIIAEHFVPSFMAKGGYENFTLDSTSSGFEEVVKVPRRQRGAGVKGDAEFFYELDTLANVKKIWIVRLRVANKRGGEVLDDIVFLDQNHIGFELGYLREVDFEQRRKDLAIFLLENEWANRRFRLHNSRKITGFDKSLGNEYLYWWWRVKFELED